MTFSHALSPVTGKKSRWGVIIGKFGYLLKDKCNPDIVHSALPMIGTQ